MMRVFAIAGEPSGDALGAALMRGLVDLGVTASYDGVGGPLMAQAGLSSRFEMSELSVMGLAEILPRYRHLRHRIAQTAEAVLTCRPDVLLTIDSPDFCLRVARQVRRRARIPVVHYVAPSVWAWRPGRAARMARVVDHVLALLPFEPDYMRAAGISCDFVGHPVAAQPVPDAGVARAFRDEHSLGAADPLVLVLPGSRIGEVRRLAPVFGAAMARFAQDHPQARGIVLAAGPVRDALLPRLAHWPRAPLMIDGRDPVQKAAAFAAADLALAASGTVSLELAASATPMVIGYRMNPLTFAIMRRMARVDTVTLVNLVSGSRAVPEFLGPACTAPALSRGLAEVWADPGAQHAAMADTMRLLGRGGGNPGLRAAQSLVHFLRAPTGAP